jgi:ATP-dependent DNA helicase RecG
VFYRAGIIEKWGTGTLNIIDWCRENGNPQPEWKVRTGSVVVTFKPLMDNPERQPESGVELEPESQPESGVELEPESQPESLREKIIQLLSRGPLSKADISKQLGQKQISGPLNKTMKSLVEDGDVTFTIPEKPKSRLQKYRLVKEIERKNRN